MNLEMVKLKISTSQDGEHDKNKPITVQNSAVQLLLYDILQGSKVWPIWLHMQPNFSIVQFKKIWGRTGAISCLTKKKSGV